MTALQGWNNYSSFVGATALGKIGVQGVISQILKQLVTEICLKMY